MKINIRYFVKLEYYSYNSDHVYESFNDKIYFNKYQDGFKLINILKHFRENDDLKSKVDYFGYLSEERQKEIFSFLEYNLPIYSKVNLISFSEYITEHISKEKQTVKEKEDKKIVKTIMKNYYHKIYNQRQFKIKNILNEAKIHSR